MRFRVAFAAVLAGAVLAAGTGPASAACQMTKFRIPVEMEGLRPMVVGKVDGHEVRFLVDSGAFFNGIGAKFAAEQKMKPALTTPETGSRLSSKVQAGFVGVGGGERVSAVVQADDFQFAGTKFGRAVFMTLPLGDNGILGQNFLHLTDVEYDFKGGVIYMADVKDCKTANLAYWTQGPYSMLPLRGDDSSGTVATVLINGQKMKAVFDTGAGRTFITRRAAARAGVKVTDSEVKEAGVTGGLDGVPIKTWTGRFASVKIDTEEIINGSLQIGDTEANDFDLLIGADFFLAHHVYVANSQGKIYFTHNGGAVFSAGPPAGAAAAGQGAGDKKP